MVNQGTGVYRPPNTYLPRPLARGDETRSRGMKAVAIIFFVSAALSVARATVLRPWLPTEMSQGVVYAAASFQVILGLALLQGSNVARKFVVIAAWVFFFLAMAGAVVALAQMPLAVAWITGLLVTVLLILPVVALTALLSGDAPSSARVWVCVGVLTVYGLGGYVLEIAAWRVVEGRLQAQIAEWAAPDQVVADEALGLRIALPEGWTLLRKGNPLVPDGAARLSLAHVKSTALAVLTVEELRSGPTSADSYVDQLLKKLQQAEASVKDVGREHTAVGAVPARQLLTSWREKGRAYRGFLLAWLDGDRYFALSGWSPEARSVEARQSFEALEKGIAFTPVLSKKIDAVVGAVAADSPHLSRAAVLALLGKYPGRNLSGTEIFRLGHYWAVKGLAGLPPAETKEMGELTSALFGAIPSQDRARLGEYLERVRFGRPTSPKEDGEMCRVMKMGAEKLPAESLQRLQAILEKAISVGVLLEAS